MALHALRRCNGFLRSVVSGTHRAPVCKTWYGTFEDADPKQDQLPPPRPASSFILFYRDKLPEIKLNNPGQIQIGELAKKAGEMWRNLPYEERQRYLGKSKDARVIYYDKLNKYNEGLSPDQLQELKQEKWMQQEVKRIRKDYKEAISKHPIPKKPKQPVWLYGETVEKGDVSFLEVTAKVRAGWKELSYSEREVYESDYQRQMEQWKKDYGIWVQTMIADGYLDFITHSELKQELRRLGMPKQPLSAFMFYSRASQMERGNMSMTEFAKELGSRWKQMTDKEKQVFHTSAKIEKDIYIKNMSQWRADLTAEEVKFTEMAEKIIKRTLEKELDLAEQKLAKQAEKEKLTKLKEKEKQAKLREKQKLAERKEKQKLAEQKEKEKLAKQKEKEKLAKQKEKEKLAKQKEKEKLAKQKEKDKKH